MADEYVFKFRVGDRVRIIYECLHKEKYPGPGTVCSILTVSNGYHRYRMSWDGIKYDQGGYFSEDWLGDYNGYADFLERISDRIK